MLDARRSVYGNPFLLLPIRSGQRVLILSEAVPFEDTIVAQNIMPIIVLPAGNGHRATGSSRSLLDQAILPQRSLPIATASIDHILVPKLTQEQSHWVMAEVARVLKPGGWLFVYARNNRWTNRLSAWGRTSSRTDDDSNELSLSTCNRLLEQANLTVLNRYGVHDDPAYPGCIVPLEQPGVVRYFFQRLFVPHSWQGSLAQRYAIVLIAAGLQGALFRDVAVIARRPLPQERHYVA